MLYCNRLRFFEAGFFTKAYQFLTLFLPVGAS